MKRLSDLANLILDRPHLNTAYPIIYRDDADTIAALCNSRLPEDLQAVAIDYSSVGFRGAVVIEQKAKPENIVFERGRRNGATATKSK